ncbi:Metallo-dependent phosphatase-like protein [Catenaria anguillulae PL171]|uniref:Metallo-dependent phosphatase-like protein n=1 Tax=Catenaria anguillulae PL171 TaxID=765915 RepID=A0A1Y2HP08_9FUNG|nr:Metallo-dependent phosphatase-like protein [Catenaria anguillulae PL171]
MGKMHPVALPSLRRSVALLLVLSTFAHLQRVLVAVVATPAPVPHDQADNAADHFNSTSTLPVPDGAFYVICDAQVGCRSEQFSSSSDSAFLDTLHTNPNDHTDDDPSVFLASSHTLPTDSTLSPPARSRRKWSPGLAYHGDPGEPYVPRHSSAETPPYLPDAPNDHLPFSMTLIHTNDIHAHYDEYSPSGTDCLPTSARDSEPTDCMGGIARLRTIIDRVRLARPHVYLVDAGDQFQGTLFHNYFRGNASAAFMNAFGYDIMALGNHEFDEGVALLARFIRMLGFPVVACNLAFDAEHELSQVVAPYAVLNKYGVRLGVVGYITPTTGEISRVGPNLHFSNPIAPIQQAIDALHALGVRKIIAVAHNGYAEDMHVAANTRGLALIVGGHSHTLLHANPREPGAEGPYPTLIKNLDGEHVVIVQAKAWGEWVGVLDLDWDAQGKLVRVRGEPVHLTSNVTKHKATQRLVEAWRAPFDEWSRQVVGETTRAMLRDACRWGSCALGNLVADALRDGYLLRVRRGRSSRDAELEVDGVFSLMNTGGLRADMPKGNITMGEVTTILPFSNEMVAVQVSGAYVLEMLENIVADTNPRTGHVITSFAQTAGLYATLDVTLPERHRVVSAWILDDDNEKVPVDPAGTFLMVTLDYIAEGGDQMLPWFWAHGELALMGDIKDHVVRLIRETGVVVPNDEARLSVVVDEGHPWVRGHL